MATRPPVTAWPLGRLLSELRRRNVFRAATIYVAAGLGILSAGELILDPLGLTAAQPILVVLVLLGFPLALVLAWAYELKRDAAPQPLPLLAPGTQDHTGRRDAPLFFPTAADGSLFPGRVPSRQSVAVLPFLNRSGDGESDFFADGITDDVIAQLSKISALKVISRTSVMAFKGND